MLGSIGCVRLALPNVLGNLINVVGYKVTHLLIPHLSVTPHDHEPGKEGSDRFVFALFN